MVLDHKGRLRGHRILLKTSNSTRCWKTEGALYTRFMPQPINATVIAAVAIVKAGKPAASINGTESAVKKPPPMMGRVMICR